MFTFHSLFIDTKNFVINNIKPISLVLLTIAVIAQLLVMLFLPDPNVLIHIFNQLNGLPESQQHYLMSTLSKFIVQSLLIYAISAVITISISLSTIYNLSNNQFTFNNILSDALKTVPQIILFMISTLFYIVILTLISLLLSLPLIMFLILLVGAFFGMSIYFLFFGITTDLKESDKFILKIQKSIALLKQYPRSILTMVSLWFLAITFVRLFVNLAFPHNFIIQILGYFIEIFIDFFAICYFYRLYMLTKKTV
ncbi:hypothetical protein PT276_03840 [Orbaceae bacterium ESL0721]|nr:hypothetical protein [Orbaceae bacterium ESL0721]